MLVSAAGDNPFLSAKCAVCIERNPLLHCSDLLKGLQMWFVVFYVFNLQYPPNIAATPEFMQR